MGKVESTWIAPNQGWIKINNDKATTLNQIKVGCGGLLKIYKVEWIGG